MISQWVVDVLVFTGALTWVTALLWMVVFAVSWMRILVWRWKGDEDDAR